VSSIEGSVVRTLVDLTRGAELLVMGSRGHGKLADLILGSVSESCAAKSKCPVVIVHGPA
jgi:nucleotide-binding universal stress UspA family protein